MAVRISELPTTTSVTGDEVLPIVQNGVTKGVAIGDIVPIRITPAEIAAGVTVVSSQYDEGVADRYATNTTPGTTDMTAAIQAALNVHNAGGREARLLDSTYLTGDIDWPGNNLTLRGIASAYAYNSSAAPKTVLISKAGATNILDLVQTGIGEDRTGNHIVDLEINGNSIAATGIKCAGANILERVRVRGCTTAGVHLANFTNSTHLLRCGLNQNSGVGLKVDGVSTTVYSAEECNFSLNTVGGVDLDSGIGVKFSKCVIESNTGFGLKINRGTTGGAHACSHMTFEHVWLEDNGTTAPNYTLVIDADTADESNAPSNILFKKCRINPSSDTRKYMNIDVGKHIVFEDCSFDGCNDANAIVLSSNAYDVAFIDSTEPDVAAGDGLTATQIDNAIATGVRCYWHTKNVRRVVGAGAPAAAFENSWTNHSATFPSAAYWFDRDGNVCIEGTVKDGLTATTVFTLPAGYRPSTQYRFVVDANGAFGRVIVDTDGTVDVDPGDGTATHLFAKFHTS